MIDYSALDPGIRETVRLVRSWGFETTDSGDGVSKLAQGYDPNEMLDVPHVFIHATRHDMADIAERLSRCLIADGLDVGPLGSAIGIQATYDPMDQSASVALYGLSDALLAAEPS